MTLPYIIFPEIGKMKKENKFRWLIINSVFLLILTRVTSADMMKIDFDFSFSLSIPFNQLAMESRTTELWLKRLAEYFPYTSDRSEYNSFEEMLALGNESLILSSYNQRDIISSKADVFDSPLYETNFYTPINDIRNDSITDMALFPPYDPSNMIGRKNILDSDF